MLDQDPGVFYKRTELEEPHELDNAMVDDVGYYLYHPDEQWGEYHQRFYNQNDELQMDPLLVEAVKANRESLPNLKIAMLRFTVKIDSFDGAEHEVNISTRLDRF